MLNNDLELLKKIELALVRSEWIEWAESIELATDIKHMSGNHFAGIRDLIFMHAIYKINIDEKTVALVERWNYGNYWRAKEALTEWMKVGGTSPRKWISHPVVPDDLSKPVLREKVEINFK